MGSESEPEQNKDNGMQEGGKSEKWSIKGERIKVVNKIEYVGVMLSSRNSWKEHIYRMKMKGVRALGG